MNNAVTLVDSSGSTSVHIDVAINEDGDLVFSGQDIGEAPTKIFGDSDYEYWLTVRKQDKDRLLLLLLKEMFLNDNTVISTMRDLLASNEIPCEFFSY